MNIKEILKLAESHGLSLKEEMNFNEMGIDFKVVFATDMGGKKWVLRIPRRNNLAEQIDKEKNILNLAKKHLAVAVPNWEIASSTFIAYPLLANEPVFTYDAKTYEVTWHMAQDNPHFVPSLAKVLVELHQIPAIETKALGLKILTSETMRQEVLEKIEIVKSELGISSDLETRWRRWLDNDNLWPNFTTFIQGDLYAGHILATKNGIITGIIDWSEGQVSDPSTDFSGHFSVFGEESLKRLIVEYERLGGRVWNKMFEQTVERHAATPLNYGYFAVITKNIAHMEGAKVQLG